MSRLFDDANPDFLETDTALFTTVPFSASCQFRTNDLLPEQTWFWVGDKDVAAESWTGAIEDDLSSPANKAEITARGGGSSTDASTTIGVSVNTWHHLCVSEAVGNASRAAFLDGSNKGTSTTALTPVGADRTSIGRSADSTPSDEMSGNIGQVAVWDIVLLDSHVGTLAAGWSPRQVIPDSLIAFWPIGGTASPEIDIVGRLDLTITGTPAKAEYPPIPHAMVA